MAMLSFVFWHSSNSYPLPVMKFCFYHTQVSPSIRGSIAPVPAILSLIRPSTTPCRNPGTSFVLYLLTGVQIIVVMGTAPLISLACTNPYLSCHFQGFIIQFFYLNINIWPQVFSSGTLNDTFLHYVELAPNPNQRLEVLCSPFWSLEVFDLPLLVLAQPSDVLILRSSRPEMLANRKGNRIIPSIFVLSQVS